MRVAATSVGNSLPAAWCAAPAVSLKGSLLYVMALRLCASPRVRASSHCTAAVARTRIILPQL